MSDEASMLTNSERLPGSIPDENLVKYEIYVVTGNQRGSGTGKPTK